jgi:hypothetical protein
MANDVKYLLSFLDKKDARIAQLEAALEKYGEALRIYADFEKDQKPHWFIAREALGQREVG